MKRIREVSVFVDESGSFDSNPHSSQYYLVSMVFHDQSADIGEQIRLLNVNLAELSLPEEHAIHAGPLVRWEEPYRAFRRQERRVIFARLMAFLRRCDVSYRCFSVDKRFVAGLDALRTKLLERIRDFLVAREREFLSYDDIKVYYDHGQSDVLHILEDAFAVFGNRVSFVPNVTPEKYRLFQVADMIATLELIRLKLEDDGRISSAEKEFFRSIGNLRKNFLKPILRKEMR